MTVQKFPSILPMAKNRSSLADLADAATTVPHQICSTALKSIPCLAALVRLFPASYAKSTFETLHIISSPATAGSGKGERLSLSGREKGNHRNHGKPPIKEDGRRWVAEKHLARARARARAYPSRLSSPIGGLSSLAFVALFSVAWLGPHSSEL